MCMCMCAQRPGDIATPAPTQWKQHVSWARWIDLLDKHVFRQLWDLICLVFSCFTVSQSLGLSISLSRCVFFSLSHWVSCSLCLSLSLSLISFSLSLSMLCLQLLDGDYIVHEHVDLICDHMTHSCVWHDSFATWWLFLYVTWLSERRLRLSRTYWLDLLQAPALHEVSYVLSFICV